MTKHLPDKITQFTDLASHKVHFRGDGLRFWRRLRFKPLEHGSCHSTRGLPIGRPFRWEGQHDFGPWFGSEYLDRLTGHGLANRHLDRIGNIVGDGIRRAAERLLASLTSAALAAWTSTIVAPSIPQNPVLRTVLVSRITASDPRSSRRPATAWLIVLAR